MEGQKLALRHGAQATNILANLDYHNSFNAATFEAQHSMRYGRHQDVFGVCWQGGDISAQNRIQVSDPLLAETIGTNFFSATEADFSRQSIYAYHTLDVAEGLQFTGGLSYDHLAGPLNYRRPPVYTGEMKQSQISPKAALIWSPASNLTARAMWARSLGGVSIDQSFRLEPTQLAGFCQTYRSLINEGLVGSVELPKYDTAGAAFDFKLGKKTFLGLSGERLQTGIDRVTGYLDWQPGNSSGQNTLALGTPETLDYMEYRSAITLDQILADRWFGQLQYRFTRTDLDTCLPGLQSVAGNAIETAQWANLHELRGSLRFQHEAGPFVVAESAWYHQQGVQAAEVFDPPTRHSDWLVQLNLYAGMVFWRQHAELTFGVMNLADADYRFSPVSPLAELPRSRLFFTRLSLNF